MRTLTYPQLVLGQEVALTTSPNSRSILRALLPKLMLGQDLHGPMVFWVMGVGLRKSVVRHEPECIETYTVPINRCMNCKGIEVTFDTDIWIACELPGGGYYQSRSLRNGTFVSPVTSEMLDLVPEDSGPEPEPEAEAPISQGPTEAEAEVKDTNG